MIDVESTRAVGHLMRRCQQQHDTLFAIEMAAFDITPPQLAALNSIGKHPAIELTMLSELIAYDCSTAGGIIDRLESKGLVRRVVAKQDRRKKQLLLTTAGKACLREALPTANRVSDQLLERIPPDARDAFLQNLRRIAGVEESPSQDDALKAEDVA